MTCIVGLKDNGKVYIGGDSAAVGGYQIRTRKDSKVFIKGNMIFGFTTSFRMGQLIRYSLSIPDHDPRVDDYEYMCTSFINAVIKCFNDNNYARNNSNEIKGGTFLVGYNGRLYTIFDDFQVAENDCDYASVGCGEEYALGALYAIEEVSNHLTLEDKIEVALKAAAKFSSGVSAPFDILCLE